MNNDELPNPLESMDPPPEQGEETPIVGDEQGTVFQEKKRRNWNTLFLVGLMLAVGAATYFMYKVAGGPTGVTPRAEVAAADTTINSFLSGGSQSIQSMVSNLHQAEAIKDRLYSYSATSQIPYDKLKAHPFGDDDDNAPATNDLSQEDARLAAESTLKKLKLESIMYSGNSRDICMINGRVYGAGEGSGSFKVEKIFAQKVQLRIGTFDFELSVAPPPDSETQE